MAFPLNSFSYYLGHQVPLQRDWNPIPHLHRIAFANPNAGCKILQRRTLGSIGC